MIGRIAAVVIPLFSLNSAHDLGRGDISGMLPMGDLARAMGFHLIQLLPLDETAPGELSPYSAMSIAAIDPSYLTLAGLPGIDPAALAKAHAANLDQPLDQLEHRAAKLKFLDQAFQHFRAQASSADRTASEQFGRDNFDWLPDYARFRALKEKYHWA